MEMLAEIFAAADAQVRAAGGLLAGGHTIRDAEPKYGLAVVGTVHPDGIWPKNGAQPGDALFLTKPLGTGPGHDAATSAGEAGTQQLERAIRWMRTLNNDAADVLRGARAERGHRRDRLRPVRPRARDRRPQRRAHPARVRALPGDRRRARRRAPGRAHERRPAQPRLRGGAPRRCERRARGAASRSATTRRRPAACSSRSRPSGRPRSRPSSRRASSSSAGSAASRRAPASSSSDRPRDDPRAVPAVPQRPPRVPARRGRALRRGVRRDHEPRSRSGSSRRRPTRCGTCPSRTRTATSSGC